ncbi:hypothetical protein RCL1_000671 [Eukaryota sp. TZLM3-RCL]
MTDNHSSEISRLCEDCHQFFGSAETHFRCSVCYKHFVQRQGNSHPPASSSPQSPPASTEAVTPTPVADQADKNRCFTCSKKLNLLGIQCKCSYIFCAAHRDPSSHSCTYDFRGEHARKLSQVNTQVAPSSLKRL